MARSKKKNPSHDATKSPKGSAVLPKIVREAALASVCECERLLEIKKQMSDNEAALAETQRALSITDKENRQLKKDNADLEKEIKQLNVQNEHLAEKVERLERKLENHLLSIAELQKTLKEYKKLGKKLGEGLNKFGGMLFETGPETLKEIKAFLQDLIQKSGELDSDDEDNEDNGDTGDNENSNGNDDETSKGPGKGGKGGKGGTSKKPRQKPVPRSVRRQNAPTMFIYDYPLEQIKAKYQGAKIEVIGEDDPVSTLQVMPATVYRATRISPIVKITFPDGKFKILHIHRSRMNFRSEVSADLLAHLITEKVVNSQPINRQLESWKTKGIDIPRSDGTDWVVKYSRLLFEQVYAYLLDLLFTYGYIHIDETYFMNTEEITNKQFLFILCSGELVKDRPRICLYHYCKDRAGDFLRDHLSKYKGVLSVDCYGLYQALASEYTSLVLATCWVHNRRYFYDAYKLIPASVKKNPKLLLKQPEVAFLLLIGRIFHFDTPAKKLSLDERNKIRQRDIAPIVDRFYELVHYMCDRYGVELTKSGKMTENGDDEEYKVDLESLEELFKQAEEEPNDKDVDIDIERTLKLKQGTLGDKKCPLKIFDKDKETAFSSIAFPSEITGALHKALKYAGNNERYFREFLKDGNIAIDNSFAERCARIFARGRDNFHCTRSTEGAFALMYQYSLVETAKENGADPYFYLKYLFEELIQYKVGSGKKATMKTIPKEELVKLMPWSPTYKQYESEQKANLRNSSFFNTRDKAPWKLINVKDWSKVNLEDIGLTDTSADISEGSVSFKTDPIDMYKEYVKKHERLADASGRLYFSKAKTDDDQEDCSKTSNELDSAAPAANTGNRAPPGKGSGAGQGPPQPNGGSGTAPKQSQIGFRWIETQAS